MPIFQSLASMVAEISKGSQIFWMLPSPTTPSNFGPKRCFLASNTPYPSGVKIL